MQLAIRKDPSERERIALYLYERLHAAMAALGLIFLLVVVSEALLAPDSAFRPVLAIAAWTLWAIFVLEFLARLTIAPSTSAFLKRNWWQLLFLLLPFLNFLRLFQALRVTRAARAGRVVSAAVRGTRSARSQMTGRIGWLAAVTVIVILTAANILYEFAGFDSYAAALHDAAMATIAGQPVAQETPVANLLEVVLALYSVVVFASLAGTVGAYFLEARREEEREER